MAILTHDDTSMLQGSSSTFFRLPAVPRGPIHRYFASSPRAQPGKKQNTTTEGLPLLLALPVELRLCIYDAALEDGISMSVSRRFHPHPLLAVCQQLRAELGPIFAALIKNPRFLVFNIKNFHTASPSLNLDDMIRSLPFVTPIRRRSITIRVSLDNDSDDWNPDSLAPFMDGKTYIAHGRIDVRIHWNPYTFNVADYLKEFGPYTGQARDAGNSKDLGIGFRGVSLAKIFRNNKMRSTYYAPVEFYRTGDWRTEEESKRLEEKIKMALGMRDWLRPAGGHSPLLEASTTDTDDPRFLESRNRIAKLRSPLLVDPDRDAILNALSFR